MWISYEDFIKLFKKEEYREYFSSIAGNLSSQSYGYGFQEPDPNKLCTLITAQEFIDLLIQHGLTVQGYEGMVRIPDKLYHDLKEGKDQVYLSRIDFNNISNWGYGY